MPVFTTESLRSADGNVLGYRRLGSGPGLILLHGGMMAAQNFMRLAELLSDSFTVYVPDRRGRGSSGPTARKLRHCPRLRGRASPRRKDR